jgi:ESCRT-II complex subunit VPS25
LLYAWVEETGQKGSVLTIYELRESESVEKKEWRDMDEGMLRKVLGVLVKRGKAQVFGQAEGEGVKFF